jgi:hypothetical protein
MAVSPSTIARGWVTHGERREFAARAGVLDGLERTGFFALPAAFFARTDILLRESLWSFRSALSTYRIDRCNLVAFFARTSVLLREAPGSLLSAIQIECPPEAGDRPR